jgi:hypothetical protein
MQREAYIASMSGSAPYSKKIGSGPIKWLLKGKKKLWVHTTSLSNRSMNKHPNNSWAISTSAGHLKLKIV